MTGPKLRVHIAPLGAETERITKPGIDWRADRMVLLDYLPPGPYEHIHQEVLSTLEDENIEYDTPRYEIGDDLFEAVGAVSKEIKKHEDDLVYVNLASGSKVTAIGGMIAAMTSEVAEPYYVPADDSGSVEPTPAMNVRDIEQIPRYPMERPEYQHIAVMKFIADSHRFYDREDRPYHDKTSLYEFGEAAELPFMSEVDESAKSNKKHNHLRHKIIDPLKERDYIDVEPVGTHDRVMLTELGRNTLRSFEHLLSEETLSVVEDMTRPRA